MLTIGDKFPSFDLKAVVSTDPKTAFKQVSDKTDAGKWKVVFFWPKDFTFVCPTEIAGLRQARQGVQRARRGALRRLDRLASSCTWPGARTTTT